jgi:hypothetical protein
VHHETVQCCIERALAYGALCNILNEQDMKPHKDRHGSREFIEFLKLLDAAYPPHAAIKLILDDHPAHISKETKLGSCVRST